jgi:O-succinylbenzoate synthase
MSYEFQFYPYKRHFCKPLKTHHGIWKIRDGIILRLIDERGNLGWGEIAPLPWFGSENLVEALDLCLQLGTRLTEEVIATIPDRLPACQFGFESALEDLFYIKENFDLNSIPQDKICHLLPTGESALQEWRTIFSNIKFLDSQSSITLKWKIGVNPIDREIDIFERLLQTLPSGVKLRLDANGGLSLEEAEKWLTITDRTNIVEFIEQPLPPQQFEAMLKLNTQYSTPLALDESVANLKQLANCYQRGWQGVFVIKVAIAGSSKRLRQFCLNHKIDAVFSSVFETKIGREAALRLAKELSNPDRAVGFGVEHWFKEDEDKCLEALWKNY